MNSRELILQKVKAVQSAGVGLPNIEIQSIAVADLWDNYKKTLQSIGGRAIEVPVDADMNALIQTHFPDEQYILSVTETVASSAVYNIEADPHSFDTVDLAVIPAQFAVAENGAVWLTETHAKARSLPFICQHLAVIVRKEDIVANMHEAYDRIGMEDYPYGVFIAGPSKTADIEQSLVLGAHGPKTMTVFILE